MPVTYTQKASCLKSDVEKCQYLARLLLYGGTKLLREKFDSIHKPESLALMLNDPVVKRQLEEILTDEESQCLYPMFPFRRISSTNFDLWLILKLSRTICGLKPPVTGWYSMPHGVTFVDDLARIEHFCRTVYDEEMTDVRFNYLWRSISEVFLRIAGGICPEKRSEWEMIIDEFLQDRQGLPEVDNYVAELRSWRKRQLAEIIHRAGDALARGWVDELINPPSLGSVVTSAVTTLVNRVTRMFSTETTDDIKTPHEILARGPLALEIYSKALEEGKTIVRRIPIMLVGQEEVGKTSLKKSLKGERYDANEQRTKGIELDPSYCRVTKEVWRLEKSNQTTCSDSVISFDHHAAQLIARGLTTEKETSKTACGLTMEKETSKCKAESGESLQCTNNVDPERGQSFSSRGPQTGSRLSGCLPEHEKPEVPDDVANLTQKIISKDIKLDEGGVIHFVLWDFGGQSVYYVTHPLFLTPRAIYLLVYDLSQNPLDKASPVRRHGLFNEFEDSFSSKTNLDYLDSWMSTVASLTSHEGEIETDHLSEKLPEKLPPVVLVCTHADQPYGGRDAASVAAKIFGSLQGKPYSGHLFDRVFAVDNTKSGSSCECPEVLRLRNELLALAKELPQTNEQIPLKWLKFEQELLAKIKEGCKWISLEEAWQVAFEVCHISTEEEFLTLVKFLHDQRIIIHFDDTPKLSKMVVLDIQWLIDVFKKVITIEPYDGKGMQHKDLWLKLEKTGILDEDLLLHVWGPMFDHMQTSESLIEIMEKFSLLCSWPSSDEKKQYLVPSMLMSHPSEDIIRLVKSSQLPSLYLTFNSSQVPIGFFPRMVLQFYQWCSKEWPSPCKPQFYQNFARFHICPDEGCSVILLCHSSFIEMVVHRANDEVRQLSERLRIMATRSCPNLSSQKPDVIVARVVRRQVGLILECMPKEFVWLKNMKCEMKVLCSVCCSGGSVEYCKDHRIKHCKREECLHFWSEAELQSVQQFCDRSAVAVDPRLSLEQFVPWLTFLDEEQVIDGCASRVSFSAQEEEAKALALSTGVVESLQSASDPCSVVAHLQESLQLNQGALADPAPETTRLIRSLAVIAKSENRLDVVQHLRQITPAGTTGPLLPECLDVQKIPPPQIKKLTFNLCGGDEWKLLADKLGLTPWEIRYLDKRTINPCLEALVHIRKQRFINVNALYNALVECGLPVLADIL